MTKEQLELLLSYIDRAAAEAALSGTFGAIFSCAEKKNTKTLREELMVAFSEDHRSAR